MQDFFRLQEGFEDTADMVLTKACKRLVKQLHYEARVQAIITYHGSYLATKVTKKEARDMSMTKEEFMKVNVFEH